MKKLNRYLKRIFAMILSLTLAVETLSAAGVEGVRTLIAQAAEIAEGYVIDNGYIKVTVSDKNGGFGIRTITGDKVNKDDDNKHLLFEYDEDNTSFTSFQVTRNGETKEYIFGYSYEGSSKVKVDKVNEELVATWSVDDLTFTQTISLEKSGSNEHGTANISYAVENHGAKADVKCRILMDTALGYSDYAYYKLGDTRYEERELSIDASGYNKAFYAVDNPDDPAITAYTINASVENIECKPYKTTFAHWNNLAATVFDYEADGDLTFTNAYNQQYMTADSAYALYFDMGSVAANGNAVIGTNYGVFSNEKVTAEETMTVNVTAPEVLQYAKDAEGKEDQSVYENNGIFSAKTYIENIGEKTYDKVKILVYATGGIDPLTQAQKPSGSTYDNPYSLEVKDFNPGERQDIDWYFYAEPQATGQYAKIHYKVYNISDDATLNTGAIMTENLLGEGASYILCPGSVDKVPAIKFTGTTPDTIYTEGNRNLYLTGENFSMLLDMGAYDMKLSRVDGLAVDGQDSITIPDTQVKIDDYMNTMTISLTDDIPGKLPEGMYQLTLDYTDASKTDLTAQALRFQVKDDIKFKNDAYGFLAVIKDTGYSGDEEPSYYVRNFMTEEEYQTEVQENRVNRDAVLLEFRGVFIKNDENPEDRKVVYEGLSLGDSDNVMTLNDCLDIKNGTVTITEDDGSVTVDFDAALYTTGAGTVVYKGVAALTELEKGENFNLIPYDENGYRQKMDGQIIGLLWNNVGQAFQNLMGMLFNFKYGELGVIEHSDNASEDTRVLSFGAAMDLSFVVPAGNPSYSGRTKDYLGSSYDAADHNAVKFSPEEIRAMAKNAGGHSVGTANTEATSWKDQFMESGTLMGDDATGGDGDTRSASILIDDVLFGGKYLGVNMSIALGLPCYVDGMPALESLLTIRTVGDWAFGVSGVCNFELFYLEGSIQIMSKDGIPVPDTITFFLGGIEPGINLDGFGVLWLQGAGGGIENLYDTIFLTDTIPPLRLILEAQFSLMQVISARATLGLSLRGVDVTLSNGKLANAIPVLNYATIGLDWYPEFAFLGNVQISVLNAIEGGGYIVVEQNGFFELFLRAALQIPEVIPIVGGIQVAEANLGANMDKIWGQVEVIDIPVNITYYWGGDIDWSSGEKVYPTYPELAGMDSDGSGMSVAIGYNEETQETLYARIGFNLRPVAFVGATAAVSVDASKAVIADILETNDLSLSTEHTMKLVENGNKKLLVIEWNAENKEQAYKDVIGDEAAENPGISIVHDGTFYPVVLMDKEQDLNSAENQKANANLTYNEETKKASLAVSFTKKDAFDVSWKLYTPEGASLVLYDVEALPALTEPTAKDVSVSENGIMSVNVTGDGLEEFTKLSIVAESKDKEAMMLYHAEGNISELTENALSFALPETLASGTYELKIQAWDDHAQYYSEVSTEFTYTNKNQPSAPEITSVSGAGDYKANVTLKTENADDFEGYAFSAYDAQGNPVNGLDTIYYKDGSSIVYKEDGTIAAFAGDKSAKEFLVGGHYEYTYTDEETKEEKTIAAGFSAGDYTVSVKKWKFASDGVSVLYSDAATANITIKEPVKTEITVTPELPEGTMTHTAKIIQKEATATEAEISYQQVMYNSNDITLVLSSNTQAFNGRWKLDGGTKDGTSGKITDLTMSKTLSFKNLEEGTHTLEFIGKNQYGDSTSAKFAFTVDTQGPRLMLAEPLNGSFFDYWTGKLSVSGVTDLDAKVTVTDKTTGKTLLSADQWSKTDVDDFGRFSSDITVDRELMAHELIIRAEDVLGNATVKEVTVTSDGMGSMEGLMIFEANNNITNTKINAGSPHELKLMAKMRTPENAGSEDALYVEINRADIINWTQTVAAGESELEENNARIILNASTDAEGMITAALLVNDEGAYTVSAAFGDISYRLKALNEDNTTVNISEAYYNGSSVIPKIEVWYEDALLTEGTDYTVVYENNVELSGNESEKPTAIITGIGEYAGTLTKTFEIEYLPITEDIYTIEAVEGSKGYYRSDVVICGAEGYEIVSESGTGELVFTEEQKTEVKFRVRRISDGATTDIISLEVNIDKTAPTGTISMKDRLWNKFLEVITFGLYKADKYTVTIEGADTYSGLDKIQYVITDTPYGSIEELESADVKWRNYSSIIKPSLNGAGNHVVYAKITDKAGNVAYISSEGLYVDAMPIERISGQDRYGTAYKVADAYKQKLAVEKFEAVIVATGKNFADALAGSYLAVRKEAPILLTNGKAANITQLHNYIKENVAAGGTVYILGGEAAVPAAAEKIQGYEVVRLYGNTRYETNLEILKEAGIAGNELIVATGKNFADSLSASALKKPILLVKPGASLSAEQKAIAETAKGGTIYIIGGDGAVSTNIEKELKAYADVERVFGNTRYETSVAVANTFFEGEKKAVVASAKKFPDGLCGGPLAAAMDAPLILTADGKTDAADAYMKENAVTSGYVLGGDGALSDQTVVNVFHLKNASEIKEFQ